MSKPESLPTARVRARELLFESARLEVELATLIGRLTAFTDQLQDQLRIERDEKSGGDHGPRANDGLGH